VIVGCISKRPTVHEPRPKESPSAQTDAWDNASWITVTRALASGGVTFRIFRALALAIILEGRRAGMNELN
jgi:hypothetical protein